MRLKKKISQIFISAFAGWLGFFTGVSAFHQFETNPTDLVIQIKVDTDDSIIVPPPISFRNDIPIACDVFEIKALKAKNNEKHNPTVTAGYYFVVPYKRYNGVITSKVEPVTVWIH